MRTIRLIPIGKFIPLRRPGDTRLQPVLDGKAIKIVGAIV